MERKSYRLRCYCAGVLHTLALVWVVAWGLSHRLDFLSPAFGPTGWLPVPLALFLVFVGFWVLPRSAIDRPADR